MNILFLHHSFKKGGTETSTKLLARFFAGKGIVPYVCVWQQADEDFIKRECDLSSTNQVLALPDNHDINSDENTRFLENTVKRSGIGAIINQGPFWKAVGRFSELGCKVISVLHYAPDYKIQSARGCIEQLYRAKSPNAAHWIKSTVRYWFKGYFAKRDFRRHDSRVLLETLNNSDYFVTLCEPYKKQLPAVIGLDEKTLDGKIVAIPNPSNIVVRQNDNKEKTVLFVGRLSYWDKRCDRLLRIWKTVGTACPDWSLVILGDGEERDRLEKMAVRLKLKNCQFMGFRDPQPYYDKASVLCLTSSSEGLPMTILEAAAYEVPTIAFNINEGLEYLITDGVTGRLVAPFDERRYAESLVGMLRDDKSLRSMGINAKENLKRFEIEKIGNVWLKLLEYDEQ